jgi:ATP phosphoribosyltransferase regulatory subunit
MTSGSFNLPGGAEDILSDRAHELENLRRSLIDFYSQKGFSLVYPSIIEFADSIGGEVNSELKKRAYTFSDGSSSSEIAIRPDISQQIARIDQTNNSEIVKKYCYVGEVIKKRKDSFAKSILAIKSGIEIFGSENSEEEVIDLLIESLKISGQTNACLSIGRTEILDEIITNETLSDFKERELREITSNKSESNLIDWSDENKLSKNALEKIIILMQCYGDIQCLDKVSNFSKLAKDSMDSLKKITENIAYENIHFDMTDFPGFNYHQGLVFSAHVENFGFAIANGGQYSYQKIDGKKRPAIGFDIDLISLLNIEGNLV